MKVLGVITARGGSKGLPGKNLKLLGGKPLIAYTIAAAAASQALDRLILSTEDDAIAEVGHLAPLARRGRQRPDVRGESIREGQRQPLSIG